METKHLAQTAQTEAKHRSLDNQIRQQQWCRRDRGHSSTHRTNPLVCRK